MPQQHQPDEHATRERILREAERLFMTQGFAGVSTRDICAAAGVKQPSMYHHFGNKEALYLAVVQQWLARFGMEIQRVIAAETALRDQLRGIAVLFWQGPVGEYQAMQRDAMTNFAPEHLRAVGQSVWSALLLPIVELLRSAIAAGELPAHADPFVLMQLFWGVMDGVGGIYHRGDPMPPPERNFAIIDFYLAGARGMTPEDYAQWPSRPNPSHLFVE